jgi:hypothetical protein
MAESADINYRTDGQLQALLTKAGNETRPPTSITEQISWLSANFQNVIGLDPAQSELLKKFMAGFDAPPIRDSAEVW